LSESELSAEAARELRLLARRLAEEVLDEAESSSGALDADESSPITEGDLASAWSRLNPAPPPTSVRVSKSIQFIMTTLSLTAVIFLIFELTATKMSRAASAALAFAVVGFFYMLAIVAASLRERLLSRTTYKVDKKRSSDISVLGYVEQESQHVAQEPRGTEKEPQAKQDLQEDEGEHSRLVVLRTVKEEEAPDNVFQLFQLIMRDKEMTSRLSFIVWQAVLAIVVLASVVAGFIYLGQREFPDQVKFAVAFGLAALLGPINLLLRRLRKDRTDKSKHEAADSGRSSRDPSQKARTGRE
jgi:hypothetical protein